MYIPAHFAEHRTTELHRIVRQYPLATEPKPWKMGDSAPDFIKDMLHNIVGFEIAIHSMIGKSKLSQNRETRDRVSASDVLDARGQTAISAAMRSTD